MNGSLQAKCDQLIRTYDLMKEYEHFEYEHNVMAGAGLFMAENKEVSIDRIKACSRIIDANTGLFSELRGISKYIIRCKMVLSRSPAVYFDDLERIYRKLKPGIFSTEGSILAAMIIADGMDKNEDRLIEDTRSIYKQMGEAHRFLTSGNDLPFAAMMAVHGRDIETIHDRAEAAYGLLKGKFKADSDTIQSLSHILSLYDKDLKEMCAMVTGINNALKETGYSLSGDGHAAVLGLLVNSGKSVPELTEEIYEAGNYLKQFAPFNSIFGMDKKDRCMYAVLCVQSANDDPETVSMSAMLSATVQLIIVARIRAAAMAAAAAA